MSRGSQETLSQPSGPGLSYRAVTAGRVKDGGVRKGVSSRSSRRGEKGQEEWVQGVSGEKGQKRHAVLSEEELATFRTSFCTKHQQDKCPNSDSCERSHCLTWQRRNPYEISYCPHLCPEIQFVKKFRKMVLYRRCTRGKNCNFAHSKEEELYHPLVYKTKQCSSYPKCSRYFCPFVHEPSETRDVSNLHSFNNIQPNDTVNTVNPVDKDDTVQSSVKNTVDIVDKMSSVDTVLNSVDEDLEVLAVQETLRESGHEHRAEDEDQMTQFEGDLGEGLKSLDSNLWYDLPNLTQQYDPLQQNPYYSSPTNYNYANLSSTNSTASNFNYPDYYDEYSYGQYQYNYDPYSQLEDDNAYNYDFNSEYLYNSQELDEHFNNLSVKKEHDEYSLNDVLKFINEIGSDNNN